MIPRTKTKVQRCGVGWGEGDMQTIVQWLTALSDDYDVCLIHVSRTETFWSHTCSYGREGRTKGKLGKGEASETIGDFKILHFKARCSSLC